MRLDKIEAITPTEYSRYRYIEKIVKGIRPEIKTACDAGCGVGNLLLVLEDFSIDSKGIDVSDDCLRLAKSKIRSPCIKIEKRGIFDIDEKFDLVYLTEVLEHIADDRYLLRFLCDKAIHKGGYLIITVPAHKWLYSAFDKSAGHFRRYEKLSLLSLLRASGFKPIVCWSYGSVVSHIAANIPFLFKGKGKRELGKNPEADFDSRTPLSGIRNFSKIIQPLIAHVNIIHRIFFVVDYYLRYFDLGIEYCILCKNE